MSERSRRSGETAVSPNWSIRLIALVVGMAVALGGLIGFGAGPAAAATGSISGATFEWTFSDEANAAAFNGQCNFWSAGQSDGTAATYTAANGNATVLKLNAANAFVPVSNYATRCQDKDGIAANTINGSGARRLGQKVVFTGGTGTLDPSTGASTIQWTGTWSVNFYGTLVPFWITNPKLVVGAGGNGAVTATVDGYASDQANPDVKVPLTPVANVVIATLGSVSGANTTGFTATPAFAGLTYDAPADQAPQNRTTAGWGSWPGGFVDFQMQTGLGSYWYTSGSSTDVRKPPAPITVGYGTFTPPATANPATTATPNAKLNRAVANAVSAAGTGFNGFAGSEQGVYAGFVAASKWQPGQVPNQADFVGTVFVPKATVTGGAFTTSITIPAGTVTDPSATYGLATFCAHGCAATNRAFDTFAPVAFASSPVITTSSLTGASVGGGYSATLAASGGATPYAWALASGSLPAGLSLNASTGVISGTPTTAGTGSFTVQLSDSAVPSGQVATKALSLAVTASSDPSSAKVGVPFSHTVKPFAGVPPYRWSVKGGVLPPGLSLNPATGLISGTPTATGRFKTVVRVADAKAPKAKFVNTKFTFRVAPASMSVTPASLPAGHAGGAYSATLSAAGGTANYKFRVTSGALPTKVKLTGKGVLKGKPAVAGTSTFTVTVTDKWKFTATRTYTLTIT